MIGVLSWFAAAVVLSCVTRIAFNWLIDREK